MKNNCECDCCGVSFYKKISRQKKSKKHFCSVACKSVLQRKQLSASSISFAVSMYCKGYGYNTIARYFNVHQRNIRKYLEDNNIKLRTRSEQKKIEYKNKLTNVRRSIIHNCKVCRKPFKYHKNTKGVYCSIHCRSICEDNKQVIREATQKQIAEGRMPKSHTSIEVKIKDFLDAEGIDYDYQFPFGYWVYDFKVGNTFIEADGDYWHGNPIYYNEFDNIQKNVIKRGKQKDAYAKKRGYSIIRFWETDINNKFEEVKNEILQYCG